MQHILPLLHDAMAAVQLAHEPAKKTWLAVHAYPLTYRVVLQAN